MNLMLSSIILIFTAVVSIMVAQVFRKISVNYISMAFGAVIFIIPLFRNGVQEFNSNIFLGLIVAPLLFFEGQSTHLNLVGRNLKSIVQLTVVLVVLSMIAGGIGVWLLGGVCLPLAFILAAISTPTDATAMQSVSNGLKVPAGQGLLLRMESLFNDASGIVLLNMAALWYVNGYINVSETLVDFLLESVGGVLFGFMTASLIVIFRQFLLRTSFNSLNAQNILYIVTPFVLYYCAEQIHVSGIITVVVAGLVHNAEAQHSRLINSRQVHMGSDLVSLITEVFNSTVFVILGFMFLKIATSERLKSQSLRWLEIGILLYVITLAVRYGYARWRLKFANRAAWIFALGGVHGAVTLALAYTVAELHVATADFNLVLLSESALIILSLIVPTIVFQLILKKDRPDVEVQRELDEVRAKMVHAAIEAVNKMYLPDRVKKSVVFDLMTQKQMTRTRDFMQAWVEAIRHPEFDGAERELEMRAFMNAFLQERQYLDMISQSEVQYQSGVYQLYNEILLAESLIVGPNVFDNEDK